MELKLYNLLGKNVKILDNDDNVHIGRVHTFTPRIDNDNGFCDITILKDDIDNIAFAFYENEIKAIEIIE